MKDNYTYPVIIDYNENEVINIIFPDFTNAITCADLDDDYISIAQEYLTLIITDYEEENRTLPNPSLNVNLKNNQQLVYVNIWMPYHRSNVKEVFVKKTLTIPSWLDVLAKNNHINFSALLVKALKKELKLEL